MWLIRFLLAACELHGSEIKPHLSVVDYLTSNTTIQVMELLRQRLGIPLALPRRPRMQLKVFGAG